MAENKVKKAKPAFDLNVELSLVKNNAVRNIRVGANITFERLHKIIQAAFCFYESHLYQFSLFKNGENGERPSVEIVVDKEMAGNPKTARLPHRAKLIDYLNEYKYILYVYDFGDTWMHYIEVTGFTPDVGDESLPRLLSGENDAPPEDCGGAPGFEDFLKIIGDKKNPEYKEMTEWAKEQGWVKFDLDRMRLRVWIAGNPGRGVWVKDGYEI